MLCVFFLFFFGNMYINHYLHLNRRQAGNKLRHQAFLDGKTNPRKHNIHEPKRHDIAMHDLLNSM